MTELSKNLTKPQQLFISRVTKMVDENMKDSTLSSEFLADSCCLCRRHFARKIKQLTGMDVTNFIRSRRIQKACKMLKKSEIPVCEICVKCGIDSANYFARIFRRQMGVTPTEYRHMNRADK